eukprot:4941210-Alexandrium_andersonii.AAC.1
MRREVMSGPLVKSDCTARAKHVLLGQPPVPRTHATANEVAALAGPAAESEDEAETEVEVGRGRPAAARYFRTRKRELRRKLCTLRSGAAPGPSGWRNAHILHLASVPDGPEALLGFVEAAANGRLVGRVQTLWGAGVLEPVDQGDAKTPGPDGRPRRKLRPIVLYEVL